MATVLAVISCVVFVLYLIALFRMPTGHRPNTPTMDRFGQPLPPSTNPGYRAVEEERH